MSRITKWKVEKAKVKVVFRLQFHATHIPQLGWDKLFVSFIPADTGKVTAKTTKANVRNANCKWSDPIYETTRLLQDTKTKKYDEKLYKLVVAMGSSRAGLLGEANIDLADYADASTPASVALTLHGCNFGTVLHVTIQLLTSKTGFREFEQQRELREKGFRIATNQSVHDESDDKVLVSAITTNGQVGKVNAKVRFKSDSVELPSLEEEGETNKDCADLPFAIDGSSYTSESLCAEKHNISSTHEIDSIKSTISGELAGFSLNQGCGPKKMGHSDHQLMAQRSSDWVHGWSSDFSMDNDLAAAYEENSRLRENLAAAESSISELKKEVNSLQIHGDELGAETHRFAQQLVTEIALGEELAREVSVLKSECIKVKDDLKQLKNSKSNLHYFSGGTELFNDNVSRIPFEHMEEEPGTITDHDGNVSLRSQCTEVSPAENESNVSFDTKHSVDTRWLQSLSLMEDKVREIKNKSCLGEYDRDLGFLNAEIEALGHVFQDLRQGLTKAAFCLNVGQMEIVDVHEDTVGSGKVLPANIPFGGVKNRGTMGSQKSECLSRVTERYDSEIMLHCSSRPGGASLELDSTQCNADVTLEMKEKIHELLGELDVSKALQDSLRKKMDQMECYYEALVQELEDSHKQMQEELKSIRDEHSTCLYTVSTLESQMKKMNQDTNEQLLRFSEERHGMDTRNMELEKRADASEMALRRMRWNYSVAVDLLQKDLELLSLQVLSMFETNENLARQAFEEASQLGVQGYLEERPGDVHKDGLLVKSKGQGIQAEDNISRKTEQDLPSIDNGQSGELDTAMDSKVDQSTGSKGISLTEVPIDGKLQTIFEDGRNSLLSVRGYGIPKVENVCRVTPSQEVIQGKLNLAIHADLAVKSEICLANELQLTVSSLEPKLDSREVDDQKAEPKKLLLEEELLLDRMKKSLSFQKELHHKAETELSEIHQLNMHLEIYSKVLQETLCEANDGIRLMEEKMEGLMQQLGRSTDFKELLVLKLQSALDDVKVRRENETKCMARCDDLTLKNHNLEAKLQDISVENSLLTQKVTECEKLIIDYSSYKSTYEACAVEKTDLKKLLQKEILEKNSLQSEISSVGEDLRNLKVEMGKQTSLKDDAEKKVAFIQDKLEDLRLKMVAYDEQLDGQACACKSPQQELKNKSLVTLMLHLEELQQKAYENILQLSQEKKDAEEQRDIAQGSLRDSESQILFMKEKFESDKQNIMTQLDVSNARSENLCAQFQDLAYQLKVSAEAEEKYIGQNKELSSRLTVLEIELQHITNENMDLAQKIVTLESLNIELEKANRDLTQRIMNFESLNEELERAKVMVNDYMVENRALRISVEASNEDFLQQAEELGSLKETLGCSRAEVQFERDSKGELEAKVAYLSSQLNDKHEKLLCFTKQKAELVHLQQQILHLELENSKVKQLLLNSMESQRKANQDASCLHVQVDDLETHLAAMLESLLAADVEVTFMKFQFQTRTQELVSQIKYSDEYQELLQLRHLDVVTALDDHMASEARHNEEHETLLTELSLLRLKLETVINGKRDVEDFVNERRALWDEIENGTASTAGEVGDSKEKVRYEAEIEQLKSMLENSEEELDNLRCSRDGLEIMVVVLRSKLDEQLGLISLLNEHSDELEMLRKQHNELTKKLSEQISKTEEFKNLSIHLRELKEKADANSQIHAKREIEGPSVAMQDSLRIAFIREQYETKLQELRNQLFASRKHGEEMLLKLQNALDELETRKKSEASITKINEEFSKRILELETEVQMVLSDKREKVKAYDRMKAELECSIISLECCKEERQKVDVSLQECNEERTRLTVELNSIMEQLENSRSCSRIEEQGNRETDDLDSVSIESFGLPLPVVEGSYRLTEAQNQAQTSGDCCSGEDIVYMAAENEMMDSLKFSDMSVTFDSCRKVDTDEVSKDGNEILNLQMKLLFLQDEVMSKSAALEASRQMLVEKDAQLQNNIEQVALISERFKEECLNSSMDHLHKELERMKNENLAPFHSHHVDPATQAVLQREMLQLHMANEQLGNFFPLFNEIPGSGNVLERVLALEIELAEALQAKKKSTFHFQSSFLKQLKDEEAIFQSFRDINELIKEMLEIKRRNASLETELKEMHERYSQLSLQFAEVEGERQQLVMTLKNIRVSKKP